MASVAPLLEQGELCVEGSLLKQRVVLEVYGDGADCNGASSRVLFPERRATHRVVCFPVREDDAFDFFNKRDLEAAEGGFVFDRFVTMSGDWYFERPPFDKVLVDVEGVFAVLDFVGLRFELAEIVESVNEDVGERSVPEVLDRSCNQNIVHMPGRAFPALVVQGDTMSSLYRMVLELEREAKLDGEAKDIHAEIVDWIRPRLRHYESVLARHGFQIPYILDE